MAATLNIKALEPDQPRVGPALFLIAQLYRADEQALGGRAQALLKLRQRESRPILDKLHAYLLEIQAEVLPKSPASRAVQELDGSPPLLRGRRAEDQQQLHRTEYRGVAVGRNNWTSLAVSRSATQMRC